MVELRKIAAFEIAKHSLSEEVAFRIYNRRNTLLGLWAASHLGMNRIEAEAYAREMVATGLQRGGNDLLVHRIRQDFAAHKVEIHENTIRRETERLMSVATLEQRVPQQSPRPVAA